MNIILKSSCLILSCVSLANAEFVAAAPLDPNDRTKQEMGSLIRGKDAPLSGWISKTFSGNKNEEANTLEVEKKKEDKAISKREKLFEAAQQILKGFTFAEIKEPEFIKTKKGKVFELDATGSCYYEFEIRIGKNADISVTVLSDEDSKARLIEHAKTLKNKIVKLAGD